MPWDGSLPETLHVDVTDDDIERGVASSCRKCPIALAVSRALSKAGLPPVRVYAVFDQITVYVDGPSGWGYKKAGTYSTPRNVASFMYAYDDNAQMDDQEIPHRQVRPFRFKLNLC